LITAKRVYAETMRSDESTLPVLWNHERHHKQTRVTHKDNPQRRFTGVVPISWHEKAAALGAVVCILSILISPFPFIPLWYASKVGWMILPCVPLFYHGKDALMGFFWYELHCVERRLRISLRPNKIILVRHGQSMANVNSRLYETVPDNQVQLSELGEQQALVAGENLRLMIGDDSVRFYVSPYERSKQTFEGIIQGGKWKKGEYTVREEPRLREQDWGNFQCQEDIAKVQKQRRSFGPFYYRMPNGESGADVWDRVTSVWDSMHREFNDRNSKNYVLVTHGLTIRLFLMRYFQWSVSQFGELWNPDNCQFAVLELQSNGNYRLWGQEDWDAVKAQNNKQEVDRKEVVVKEVVKEQENITQNQ